MLPSYTEPGLAPMQPGCRMPAPKRSPQLPRMTACSIGRQRCTGLRSGVQSRSRGQRCPQLCEGLHWQRQAHVLGQAEPRLTGRD